MKIVKNNIKKLSRNHLTVVSTEEGVCMMERVEKKTTDSIALSWSRDGVNFESDNGRVSIEISPRKKEKIKNCSKFSISKTPNGFVMVYVRNKTSKAKTKSKTKDTATLVIARSKDLYDWQVKSELPIDLSSKATVAYDKPLDQFELYTDGLFMKVQSSSTLSIWKNKQSILFTSRNDNFDSDKLSIIGSLVTKEGIVLIYESNVIKKNQILLQVGAVLFDINNPRRIIWRSDAPVWQGVVESKSG